MDFYYLSHFIQPWILPPGFNISAALTGFFLLRYSKLIGQGIILFAFITLWLFCTPIIAKLLIDPLQNQYPRLQVNQISKQNSSAIIVLGGGHEISPESKNGYVLSGATEARLHYAAFLYKKTHFPIITSGGRLNKTSSSEAELMRKNMENYFSIPVVWKENKSADTKDEGNYMVPLLEKHGINVAYIVTNAWHMPRAMYTFDMSFKKTKIKIIAAPMGYNELKSNKGILNYLPSFVGLNTAKTAVHEYIGILVYHLNNFI